MTRVAVWLVVAVAAACGVALAASGCSGKTSCSGCIQTPNCMWCGRSGNFTGLDGKSLSRCIQRTDDVSLEWREVCGTDDVYEPANFFEMLINNELTQAGVLAGSGGQGGAAGGAGFSGETVVQIKPQHVGMRLRASELLQHFFVS
ncbi:hypothetical protein GWK47_032629 [Chionoecetes opilio]|uniref:Integrin beta N-terminal domain-containing protein n=1 Tax=Chionoecetes opilio TaxID=41210 RepID=A0A8J5D1I7_CHIOP|nr:hypothetical protein GWK47_032629 [Chionoecetes opilio]